MITTVKQSRKSIRILYHLWFILLIFYLKPSLCLSQKQDSLSGNLPRINGHYRLFALKYGLDYTFPLNPGIHFGGMLYNYESFDNNGIHPIIVWGPYIQGNLSYNYARNSTELITKIGLEYNFIYGLFTGVRINAGHITNFKDNALVISPEIGFCLPGSYNNSRGSRSLMFGLNIPFQSNNTFPISYYLSININRPLKPKKWR